MAEPTERYYAVTVFGYDKATHLPISILIPFTVKLGRYVNNSKVIELASEVHPTAILLHVSNVMEFKNSDDLLDYIAEPIQKVKFNKEDKGKIIKDGDEEPFFTMTQTMPPMFDLPFFQDFQEEVCRHCGEFEIDPDFFPFCSEICQIKGKSQE